MNRFDKHNNRGRKLDRGNGRKRSYAAPRNNIDRNALMRTLQSIPKGPDPPEASMQCEVDFNFEPCDTAGCPEELCSNVWNNGTYVGYGCSWGGCASNEYCACNFQRGGRGFLISCGCEEYSWK